MGCMGDREKGDVDESQKWDYVTLSDFHASGTLAYFSYAWLWILAIIAVAVYGADTFTAINLLAYDKWSSQIEPAIPLKYSKWIFAVCIIISWALCIFEWVRAIRVIRRGSVAESYMDSLAVTLQSMRPKGWRRFLVFAELTKSKKGVDYIALFVYFAFRGALRIVLAEGPRQVVNGITLYSFMQADLIPTSKQTTTENRSSFAQFWVNVETLAEANREQAVVLFTMLFTLIIWVISALCLIISVVLYLLFLWHYIPEKDGRLSIYCRRKIDRRLEKIMGQKVKQALEDQEKKRMRDEAKAVKKADALPTRPQAARQPTLPQIGAKTPPLGNERIPPLRTNTAPVPQMQRQPTLSDLRGPGDRPRLAPARNYTAPASTLQRQHTLPDSRIPGDRPHVAPPVRTNTASSIALQHQPTLPDIDVAERRPPMPYRTDTEASALSHATYESDAPLLGNANDMGYSHDLGYMSAHPDPMLDRQTSYASRHTPYALDRQTSYTAGPMPSRSMTSDSQHTGRQPYDEADGRWEYHPGVAPEQICPVAVEYPSHTYNMPMPEEPREYTGFTESAALPRQRTQDYQRPFPLARMSSGLSFASRQAPEPEPQSFEMTVQPRSMNAYSPPPQLQSPPAAAPVPTTGGYVAFNPSFTLAAAAPSFQPPERSFTSPPETLGPVVGAALQRSATAPPEAGLYEDLLDEYGSDSDHGVVDMPGRSASVAPYAPHETRHGW